MKSKALTEFLHGHDSIIINRLGNGFLVTEVQFEDSGELKVLGESFEEGSHQNQDHVISLLYALLDYLGVTASKHDDMRISIGYEAQKISVEEAKKKTAFSIFTREALGEL